MTGVNDNIDLLGGKIDDLAVQVGSLTDTVSQLERTVDRQATTTDRLIELAIQQQATTERLSARN